MKINRIKGKLILVGMSASFMLAPAMALAQVSDKGLSPAANTYRAYQDASIARDSGLNQPLDLLNDFYPAIDVTITDHDNVRRRPDFQEDDLKIVARPSLGYRTTIGRHQFYAAYNGTFTYHNELSQEDARANSLNAKLGLDLTRRWDLDLFAGFGDGFEERGISGGRAFDRFANNGIDSGPEEIEYLAYGADLIFGRKIGVITGVLGYEYNESGFKSNDLAAGLNAGDRDRESESVHLDVNWRFASKTSLFGRVQRSNTDYKSDFSNLDSEQTDYLIGLRVKPSNALSGVLAVGRSDRNFDDPRRDDYDGNTYYANLNYMINPFSNIELSASRIVEEPGDENSSYYESDFIGIGWNHAITPQLVFDIYAKRVDDDYDIAREDQFVDWGVGLDYVWKNWLTAGLYYGEIDRDSNVDGIDYDDSYFGIRLRSDLRSLLEGRGKRRPEPSSFGYPKKTEPAQ